MQFSLAVVGLVASLASAMPQGVTQKISPPESAPDGCMVTYPDTFSITTVNVTTSTKVKRQTNSMGGLKITIKNGVMTDNLGDTGYIAANTQFQFDNPPQTGAIYTAGWSVCANKTIALGGSTIFYSCNSGKFANLYSKSQGKQCSQVFISAMTSGPSSSSGSSSSAVSSGVSATSDGQPQGATSAASSGVSTIADNQPQAATSAGASQVSTIADNQPQAATSAGASQISTIADNQPQAATSAAGSAISTIADNQPQAATSAAGSAAISTIADNQPQAPTMAAASATFALATGAAVANRPEVLALAAGAMALFI